MSLWERERERNYEDYDKFVRVREREYILFSSIWLNINYDINVIVSYFILDY